jgi:hypothetical protein
MLSDLTHLFNGEVLAGGRPKIILGGDRVHLAGSPRLLIP